MGPIDALIAVEGRDEGAPAGGLGVKFGGFGFRVSGFGFRVSGFGFRVSGFGFQVSNRLLRAPSFVPHVVGIGRPPVQIKVNLRPYLTLKLRDSHNVVQGPPDSGG